MYRYIPPPLITLLSQQLRTMRSLNASECWILELEAEDLKDYSADEDVPRVPSLGEILNDLEDEAGNGMVLEWNEERVRM